MNVNGKVEKTVDAHDGSTLNVKWSNDATGFLSSKNIFGSFNSQIFVSFFPILIVLAGEDGLIKMWSRSGMLRSILAQYGRPVYAADWNVDGSRVAYCSGEHCYIKSLKAQVSGEF